MKKLVSLIVLLAFVAFEGMAAEGVKVEILSATSGIVRVDKGCGYVMLPIEESAPESDVRILLDGQLETTIQVRLALNRPDYFVPLDVRQWNDHQVALYVNTKTDRTSVRHASEASWSRETIATDVYKYADTEKQYRPAFHHTPRYGWMNDPNGMYYKDGVWHLCYQWNPYGSVWGNMTWGHSTSHDLIHWLHMPAAVWSNGLGTVYSGSCAIDHEGTAGFGRGAVVGMHTSAAENQVQSLVYTTDGINFESYEGNPVVTTDKECRDPKFFWDKSREAWTLVLANPLEHEMMFYTSSDMKHWTQLSSFGRGYGCQDGVWECPDLIELPVRGTRHKKWVLICNINPGGLYGGSGTQYFVGNWDGHRFTCDDDPTEVKWMDWGKDNYATVTFADAPSGRHVALGWMSNWQYAAVVPTKQYRSANTLPRELDLYVDDQGEMRLGSTPSPEVDALRGNAAVDTTINVTAEKQQVALTESGLCEIVADIDCRQAETVYIDMVNDSGQRVSCYYDMTAGAFAMDRKASGNMSFSDDFPVVTLAPLPAGGKHKLRMFVDRSSIEAFDGDGRWVMTNTVFPSQPYSHIEIYAKGKAKAKLKVYEIKGI